MRHSNQRILKIFVFMAIAPFGQALTSPLLARQVGPGCACLAPGDAEFETGRVWQGDRALSLEEIADLLAPVLWFSADEPLLVEGEGPLPHPHPCDPDQSRPVVYYQLHSVRLVGDARVTVPPEDDPAFWDKVLRLTLRYYFYYPEDRGMGGHYQDLEVAELDVELVNTSAGCYRLLLRRATGFAHGFNWYYNELEIMPDTRFPLVFLVEEGKHASCPDRNADGVYTPGYDVNRRVNDAWGVRDVFGSGFVGSSGYAASMAKPREVEFRAVPPVVSYACQSRRNSSLTQSEEPLARYDLRRASLVPACTDMGPDSDRLQRMMVDHGFGPQHVPQQRSSWDIKDLAEPLSYSKTWLPPIGLKWDRSLALSFTLFGLEVGEFGYFVPKVTYNTASSDVSIEGMLTPSAARFFSWYVSGGGAYEREVVEIASLRGAWGDSTWNFVAEAGVKFRARLSGKWRVFSLGYDFAGIRFGVRSSGFNYMDGTRLIIEIGAGIF
jgi:hypothetical protein